MSSPILRYFVFEHLPVGPPRSMSQRIAALASMVETELPDGPEKSAGLRKLLEAKDCFVRSALDLPKFEGV